MVEWIRVWLSIHSSDYSGSLEWVQILDSALCGHTDKREWVSLDKPGFPSMILWTCGHRRYSENMISMKLLYRYILKYYFLNICVFLYNWKHCLDIMRGQILTYMHMPLGCFVLNMNKIFNSYFRLSRRMTKCVHISLSWCTCSAAAWRFRLGKTAPKAGWSRAPSTSSRASTRSLFRSVIEPWHWCHFCAIIVFPDNNLRYSDFVSALTMCLQTCLVWALQSIVIVLCTLNLICTVIMMRSRSELFFTFLNFYFKCLYLQNYDNFFSN